jgi:hypothetical protein
MASSLSIPVTVSQEAAERIAELDYKAEFEQMLDRVRELVPELVSINVWLIPPYDTGDEPSIILDAYRNGRPPIPDPVQDEYERWVLATFSPNVWRHFSLSVLPEVSHAG